MNAKELVLDKINSGIDMIGMYLYGISIGFSIESLAEVLLSPAVNIILSVMKGNIFLGEDSLLIGKIFDYFLWGPSNLFNKLNRLLKKEETELNNDLTNYPPVFVAIAEIVKTAPKYGNISEGPLYGGKRPEYLKFLKDLIEKPNTKKIRSFGGNQLAYILTLCVNSFTYDTIKQIISLARALINYQLNQFDSKDLYGNLTALNKRRAQMNQIFDFIEEFAYLSKVMKHPSNVDAYNSLLILAAGSNSMLRIGAIVGLNQGIPSKVNDFIKKVDGIENYIIDLAKETYRLLHNDIMPQDDVDHLTKVDLLKFITDNNYRQDVIKTADAWKLNFNLYSLIDVMPDIREYVNGLFIIDTIMKNKSSRYNYIRTNFNEKKLKYNLSKDDTLLAMNRQVLNTYIVHFLHHLSLDLGFKFRTNINLNDNSLGDYFDYDLNSADGVALFKKWMETVVIPQLKSRPETAMNLFITNLLGSVRTNTLSKNNAVVYTLPVDMMGLKENSVEDLLLKLFISSFNSLNSNFTDINDPNAKGISIKDLFFLYSLVAFEWKPARNSLMYLFSGLNVKEGLVKSYFDYISELEEIPIDLIVSFDERLYFATTNRFKDPKAPFAYIYNPDTEKIELYAKEVKERKSSGNPDEENPDIDELNNEEFNNEYDLEEYGDDLGGYYDDNGEYGDEDIELNKAFEVTGYNLIITQDPDYFMFGSEFNAMEIPKNPVKKNETLTLKNGTTIDVTRIDGKIEFINGIKDNSITIDKLREAGIITGKEEVIDLDLLNALLEDKNNDNKSCPII